MAPSLSGKLGVSVLILSCLASLALSDGSDFIRCSADKPYCPLNESTCDSGKCVCNSGYGNGHLACYHENQHFCHIINDPVAFTFGDEMFDLPLPCRFLAADVSADRRYQRFITSQCHTKVFATNRRSMGKFFVGGFDVTVMYMAAMVLKTYHFRVNGSVNGDQYEFELSVKDNLDEWLPFHTTFDLTAIENELGGPVIFHVEQGMKRARLYIENCALNVYFRPANELLGMHQDFMPGLAIAYDHTELDLKYWLEDNPMCLTPDLRHHSTGRVANEANLNPSSAFLWRGLYTPASQGIEYHHQTDECPNVIDTVQRCTDFEMHIEAVQMCNFILSKPLFVNCMSESAREIKSSNTVMALYDRCLRAFCLKNNVLCDGVHALVGTANCGRYAYDGFVEHGCNFQP